MPTRPESFLPLTSLSLAVLLALADEDRHGYALLKEVERESGGRIRPGTGTLYAALQRLTDEALIEQSATAAPDGDPRRRYYAITALGRAVARAEVKRLAQLIELAREKKLTGDLPVARVARQKS